MQVRELVSSGTFSDLRLLTGESGLDNHMKDVVLLEYESLKQDRQQDYYQGDFIISTLFFAKDHEDLLYDTVQRLIDLGASGLAFKSSYYNYLPDRVREMAQEKCFPIFMFDDLYIEDVILRISDYLRQRQEFSMHEDSLFKILSGTTANYNIEQLCTSMNPNRQKYTAAVYAHAADFSSNWTMILRQALQRRDSRRFVNAYRFLQFRRGFFILASFTEPVELDQLTDDVQNMLNQMGCPTEQLCFGVSRIHQPALDFDCVIREAFDAAITAISRGVPRILYPQLRLYSGLFPLLRDKSFRETMQCQMQLLEQADRESASGFLVNTLSAYAQSGYNIKKTADAMNQHPNTIRYRLKKICELTANPSESSHALYLMDEFQRMDSLARAIF